MIQQREPCADGIVESSTDASPSHPSSAAEARQAQSQSATSTATSTSRPPALQIPKNRSSASLSSRFPADGSDPYENLSRCVQS
jgi:hypothetical protein